MLEFGAPWSSFCEIVFDHVWLNELKLLLKGVWTTDSESLKCVWRSNRSQIPISDLTGTNITFIGIKGNIHYNSILPSKYLPLYFPFQTFYHCLWDLVAVFSAALIPCHSSLPFCASFKHEERFCPCPTFIWGHEPSSALPDSDGILCIATTFSSSEIFLSANYLIASTCNLSIYF